MVKAASALTGQAAIKLAFEEFDYDSEFDGIWACASLLHVPRFRLGDVLARLARALRPNGVMYLSFKIGEGERVESGRLFNDIDEVALREVIANHPRLEISRCWVSEDVRNDRRGRQKWVNAIVRRSEL